MGAPIRRRAELLILLSLAWVAACGASASPGALSPPFASTTTAPTGATGGTTTATVVLPTTTLPRLDAPLPEEGVAVTDGHTVTFVGLDGRVVGRVEGGLSGGGVEVPGVVAITIAGGSMVVARPGSARLDAAAALPLAGTAFLRGQVVTKSDLVLADSVTSVSYGRDIVTSGGNGINVVSGETRALPAGCEVADARGGRWYLACHQVPPPIPPSRATAGPVTTTVTALDEVGAPVDLVTATVPPRPLGHWDGAALSPDETTLLLQWLDRCEEPTVFTAPATGGPPKPLTETASSIALGWAAAGSAVVAFTGPGCGEGFAAPGVYLVGGTGPPRLVVAGTGRALMWRTLSG